MENVMIKSSYDGLELSLNKYLIKDSKENILIVHGMQEYKERYDDFAKYLNEKGYNVYIYDKRGHGKSINESITLGFFSYEDGVTALQRDLLDVVFYIKDESPKPINLFAHSMGSIEARCFLQLNSHLVNKVVLSGAPNYQGATYFGILLAKLFSIGKGIKKSSKLLFNLSIGAFSKKIKDRTSPLDWLSYNKENIEKYENDPYCTFDFTNNGYLTIFELLYQMNGQFRYISAKNNPILFIYGEEDPCTGYEKGINHSIQTLTKVGYRNVSKISYPKMRHEILKEDDKLKVYEDIVKFYEG